MNGEQVFVMPLTTPKRKEIKFGVAIRSKKGSPRAEVHKSSSLSMIRSSKEGSKADLTLRSSLASSETLQRKDSTLSYYQYGEFDEDAQMGRQTALSKRNSPDK